VFLFSLDLIVWCIFSQNMKLNKYFIDAMYFGDELSSLEKLRALMRARLQRMVEERRALYNSGKASLRRTRRQIKIIKQVVAKLRASEPEVRTQIVESLRDVNMVISGTHISISLLSIDEFCLFILGISLMLCSAWRISAWSKCSASCGPGKQKRTVVCEKLGGSTAQCVEPAPPKTQSCLKKPCAQSCVLTSWTPFSECSVTCGGGVKERSRKVCSAASASSCCCREFYCLFVFSLRCWFRLPMVALARRSTSCMNPPSATSSRVTTSRPPNKSLFCFFGVFFSSASGDMCT
jgi:hypothetical protein